MVLTLGRAFRCYWIIIWFYKADTASSTCCYCSISRINNRRFSPHNNPSAWTMHSLKSIHSNSSLSHTDTRRFGASVCYSATSSITGKNVRHLGCVRNSCYCIEVLPRALSESVCFFTWHPVQIWPFLLHAQLIISQWGLIHLCMVCTLAMGDITAARAFTSGQGVGLGLFSARVECFCYWYCKRLVVTVVVRAWDLEWQEPRVALGCLPSSMAWI